MSSEDVEGVVKSDELVVGGGTAAVGGGGGLESSTGPD
jgi:hypothetical protein